MGRKRTYFSDKFKIEVPEKAPKKRAKEKYILKFIFRMDGAVSGRKT